MNLNDNQFLALVSFVFNCGLGNLKELILLRKLNLNDFEGAAEEVRKWVNIKGKKLNGLVYRMAAEKLLLEMKI